MFNDIDVDPNVVTADEVKAPVLVFPTQAYMQIDRAALFTHLSNLVAAFGEEQVREFMKEQFNLQEPHKGTKKGA